MEARGGCFLDSIEGRNRWRIGAAEERRPRQTDRQKETETDIQKETDTGIQMETETDIQMETENWGGREKRP